MIGRAPGICKRERKRSVEQEGKVGLNRGEVGGEEVKEEDKMEPGKAGRG